MPIDSDILQIPAKPVLLAPLIYLKRKNKTYSFFNEEYKSSSEIFINTWPSEKEWKSIFLFYPVLDKTIFARYYYKLKSSKEINASEDELSNLLSGYGLKINNKTKEELGFLSKTKDIFANLYNKKNIPVKILMILEKINSKNLEEFIKFIEPEHINNNTAKDLLNIYIDFDEKTRSVLLDELSAIRSKTHTDGNFLLANKYKEIMQKLRFPLYTKINSQFKTMIQEIHLPKFIKLIYHPYFEKSEINLEIQLKNKDDLIKCEYFFSKKENIEAINKVLNKIQNL
ncbi:MAG: hypothetical protein OEZ22_05280 [Spirochaetia bacterium]|nr:hypothetical protein [Spirochaetia bacterium]